MGIPLIAAVVLVGCSRTGGRPRIVTDDRQMDASHDGERGGPTQKRFKLSAAEIKRLVPAMGGCFASDRITVDGATVGYMYREKPEGKYDSGWRFFAGDESQEYVDDPKNFAIYEVNTICNYDETIIPLLRSPYGSAFGRAPGADTFKPEEMPAVDD
jgi:hypothetical protein